MSETQETSKTENRETADAANDGVVEPTESSVLPEAASVSANEGNVSKSDKHKIDILLKATGNAPIMKKKKWNVDQERRIGWIIEFIKKYLKLDSSENLSWKKNGISQLLHSNLQTLKDGLFLYVNQAFAPAPDQIVKNLYECYGADGKLVLHYCKGQAWG